MSNKKMLSRGVSVSLATESELEIANNNIPPTNKRSYTVLVRRISFNPCGENDTSEEVLSDDINGNSFKKPRIDAAGERGVEDDSESQASEEVEIFFDAVEELNDVTEDSQDEDVLLSDYPHLNNFPELEDDGDVAEEVEEDQDTTQPSQGQSQEAEDLHNTSNATLRPPEFSDHQWSQSQRTSELDLIIYSDRTSSEFVPDPRAYVRNEPLPTIWDIET